MSTVTLSSRSLLFGALVLAACSSDRSSDVGARTAPAPASVGSACDEMAALRCAQDVDTPAECAQRLEAMQADLEGGCPGVFQSLLNCSIGKFRCDGNGLPSPEAECERIFEEAIQPCAPKAEPTCGDKCLEDPSEAFDELAVQLLSECACQSTGPCSAECAAQCTGDAAASTERCNTCLDAKVAGQHACAAAALDACSASSTCKPFLDCLAACP